MRKFIAFLLGLSLLLGSIPALADDLPFIIRNGDREKKQVAITIDDCFNIDMVQRAYDLSITYDIPITFFVMGLNLDVADRDIWRAIAESHNEIGNHTHGHRSLPKLSYQAIYGQLMVCQAELDATLGYHYPMQVFRPPYGHLNRDGKTHVNRAVQEIAYDHAILWDVSQTDFKKCCKAVKNGSILLFHTNPKDLNCIEQLIPYLQENGYELVTVSEMIGKEPVATSTDIYEYVEFSTWRVEKGL